MKRIYKYKLETTDLQTFRIPKLSGATNFKEQLLNINTQNDYPCMWCLVDVEGELQDINIRIIGTGNPMPEYITKDNYIGTYQLCGGSFVGHVFTE